jgi:hypothetical protein
VGIGAGGGLAPVAASERAQVAAPLASAFGHTFVWAAVLTAAALVPALLLAREERSATAQARLVEA